MPGPERINTQGRRIIRNVLSGGGSQAVVLVLSFLVTPVLVAGLGLERYGLWALVGVVVNYLGLLDLGVGTAFVRFLSDAHARGDAKRFNAVVGTGLFFYLVFGSLLLALVWLVREPLAVLLVPDEGLRGEVSVLLVGVTAVLTIRSVFLVYRAGLAAVERIDLNNRITAFLALPNAVGAVCVVVAGWGLKGLVANALATACLTAVVQAWTAHRVISGLRMGPIRFHAGPARDLFSFGLRIQATRTAELINGQVDKVVLGVLVGAVSVGLYDLGLKLALLLAAAPGILLPVILPSSAILESRGDRVRLRRLHERGTKYAAIVVAPALVFLFAQAPSLLRFWIGRGDLAASVFAARLLLVAAAPMLLLGVSRLVARGVGSPGPETRASLMTAVFNIVLSIALVRRFGAPGAPIASVVAALSGAALFLWQFGRGDARTLGLSPLAPMRGPAVASLLAGLAAWACGLGLAHVHTVGGRTGALLDLVATGIAFGIVFLLVVFRGRVLDEFDFRVARETWAMARVPGGRAR